MRYLIVILMIFFLFQCGEKVDKAKLIYDEAVELEKNGELIKALKLYDSLKEFDKHPLYAKAKQDLEIRGFGIGKCLESWTCKEMIIWENEILHYYHENNTCPPEDSLKKYYDAWDKELLLTWRKKEKEIALFTIYSSGLDGIDSTNDDLILAYTEKSMDKDSGIKMNKNEMRMGLDELNKLKDLAGNSESSIALEDLEKFNKDTNSYQEKSISLDDLISKEKKKKKD